MIETVSTIAMMTGHRFCDPWSVPSEPLPPVAAAPGARDDDAHLRSADAGAVAATGGTLRLQTRIAGLVLSLGSTVVVVRYLTASEFGHLSLIIALVTIVSGISDLGLSGVGIREWIRRDAGERKLLLADLLGLRLVAIGVGAVLAVAFAIAVGYGHTVVVGMTLALVGTAFNAVQAALTIPLIAQLRQGLVGALELLSVAVQAVLQVVLVLAGAGVIPLAATMIPAGMAGVFAVLLVLRGQLPWPRFHPARLRRLLRESAAFAAAGAVSVVYLRSAVLIGPAFLTPGQFGSFSVAFRAVEPLTMLPSVLTGALFPLLTHAALHDRDRLSRGYDMLWRSTATLGAFGAAAVIGIAPLITLVFTGERNTITIDAFVLLGCALGALFVGAAGMWMLLAERRYRAVLGINVLALSCNVALTVVAGQWLGPRWFAIGIVVSEVMIALAADRVCRQGLRASGHPTPAGPVAQLSKVLLTVLAALAVFAVTRHLFPLIPFVATCAVAAAVLLLTHAVPHELLAMVREVVRRILLRRPGAGLAR
jgi:O-antigen/teichoic acid export membrane protein